MSERALVLGGGGSTGNAWEIGVIAGLFDGGLDVTGADLIIGTSAGATASAQITGGPRPPELLAAILDAPPPSRPGPSGPGRGPGQGPGRGPGSVLRRGPAGPVSSQLEKTNEIIAASADAAAMRRGIGAAALEATQAQDEAERTRRRDIVAARLPRQEWPDRRVLITAVNARTGEPAVFDRDSGVGLADAVTASCAGSGTCHGIGDDWFIDGGYRRNENADLAAGCGRVLVLSPFGGRSRHPAEWGMQLSAQVEEVRARGSRVETVFPEGDAEAMFGASAMDLTLRPAAARAGYDQGKSLAGPLAGFWS